MSRTDYNEIKTKFADYIRIWKSYNLKEVDRIFHPDVAFKTSTSKTMANGNQDSIFGVYDFINDFPKTDDLKTQIYNYVCRINGNQAFGYAEVVCTAFNVAETVEFLEFTVFVTTEWSKIDGNWMVMGLRHEAVAHNGGLLNHFEKNWHFEEEDEVGGRIQLIRGEGDSPWVNVPDCVNEVELTEEEKIKECIIKNAYGIEHIALEHTLSTFSRNYQCKSLWPTSGDRAKDRVQQIKASRMLLRYYYSPIKFRKIEINGDRAYVHVDRVRGHQQDLGFQTSSDGNVDLRKRIRDSLKDAVPYEYTKDNLDIEHTAARGVMEVVKENGQWKVAYDKLYFGIYEVGPYSESLYGDEI